MPDARFILCQRTGDWAAALRRAAKRSGADGCLDLRQTSSLPAALRQLDEARGSVLALEMTADNLDAVLEALLAVLQRYPWARTMVLARRGLEDYAPLARELGAVWFSPSPRDLRPAVRAAERHLARVPDEPRSLRQRVLARLPWRETAMPA